VSRSVVVIGGGLIGLSSALFLTDAGAEVTIIDSAAAGSGAARGNAGWMCTTMVAPLPQPGVITSTMKSLTNPTRALRVHPKAVPGLTPWLLRFAQHCTTKHHAAGRRALAELNRHNHALLDHMTDAGVVARMTKEVVVPFHDVRLAEHFLHGLHAMEEFGGTAPEMLDGDGVRNLVPALTDHINAGFLVPGDRALDPRVFVDTLIDVLKGRGVQFAEHAEITDVTSRSAGRIESIATTAGTHGADEFVLAAGAGSRLVAKHFGLKLAVVPGQGYNVALPTDDSLQHPMIFEEAHFVVTPFADRIRLGGTMEFAGDHPAFDQRRVDAILRSMRDFLHLDPTAHSDTWAGCRPMSADGLPFLGRPARWNNMVVASGHGMWGLSLAPSTGAVVSELIIDGKASVDITALHPDRFSR
jgi:D-amino-acid dehydrogenase